MRVTISSNISVVGVVECHGIYIYILYIHLYRTVFLTNEMI